MEIIAFTFNPLSENTYVLGSQNQCVIVDPGCYDAIEQKQLTDLFKTKNWNPVAVWNTHAHIDHIFGNAWAVETFQIPLYLHSLDIPLFERSEQMAALWQLKYTPSPMPNELLSHLQTLTFAGQAWEVRHVPGHSPGHVVFINHDLKTVIGGDTLFHESIGRTDLPGGDHNLLLRKIKEELYSLPEDYQILPGHGAATSVGHEKQYNPFVTMF